jgi:DNA repair exonuclease SbcCD ATPase subunit
MRRNRRNRWNTNSLTTQETYGIIQPSNRERRDMDITEVGSYISEIKEALQSAISEAETKEGEIENKVEELGRAKEELEAARGEVDEIFSALEDFDGDRLSNAIDEADSLGIN